MSPSLEDYRVELDAYAGPLDLLLLLVRRHEIDLNDIPIARLTQQYMDHLKLIQRIDMDLAGEFLVMAATLLEIKSVMLLPRPQDTDATTITPTSANPLDPRYELVQQLLAYKRFKDAANALDQRRSQWDARFPHKPATHPRPAADHVNAPPEDGQDSQPLAIELEDADVLDLCRAFAHMLESIGQSHHEIIYDDTPIALHADDILDRLARDGGQSGMTLQQIFIGRSTRAEMIGLFLATLELVRQKRIRVVQDQTAGVIRLELRQQSPATGAEEDSPTDWRDPQTGQIQYEWPSEQERRRVERRAKLRAHYAAKRLADGQPLPDELSEEDVAMDDSMPGEDPSSEPQMPDNPPAA